MIIFISYFRQPALISSKCFLFCKSITLNSISLFSWSILGRWKSLHLRPSARITGRGGSRMTGKVRVNTERGIQVNASTSVKPVVVFIAK